jgi:hypothetical protein
MAGWREGHCRPRAALVTLVLEAAFDAHPRAATALNYLAWATFAVDYAIRLRLAEDAGSSASPPWAPSPQPSPHN